MGLCGSMVLSKKNLDNENDIDKIIIIINFFMKNKLTKEQIKPFITDLLYYQVLSEKNDFVKSRRFTKWLEKSSVLKPFHYYNDITPIINLLKKQKEENKSKEENNYIKYDIFFKKGMKEISYTEIGLKNFFIKNKSKFESRLLKSPPGVFRWGGWLVEGGRTQLQKKNFFSYYEKITNVKINKKTHIEILNIIEETIKKNCEKSNLIKSCLFRLLKSIIILEPDICFIKEICYVLTFLIVISNFDEVNIFYLIISLLANDKSNKYHLRGFYIKEKYLLNICKKIFEKNFAIFFPELKEHLKQIKLNKEFINYIDNWIQICYVNVFNNIYALRIWDHFLVKGISFLINLSLSFIENFHEDLMNVGAHQDLLNFIKKLNPYDKYTQIDFNIEEIILNANNKYKIMNDEIFNELKHSYPNYQINFEYDYKNIDDKNNDKESKESLDEKLSTIDNVECSNTMNSFNILNNNDKDDNNNNICYSDLNSLINKGINNYQENNDENIELSISQKNNFFDSNCLSENSFEDIEDENNCLQEHIKDLISKQEYLSINKNHVINSS